jgi:hypothetical protein
MGPPDPDSRIVWQCAIANKCVTPGQTDAFEFTQPTLAACEALAEEATCDKAAACSWCKSAAVKSKCYSKADAKKLPPGVFACDSAVVAPLAPVAQPASTCKSDADCPCSYCMNDKTKTAPFQCHPAKPGVCCKADKDCPGSYCVNYHGPPPYHCHGNLVSTKGPRVEFVGAF